MRNTAFVVALLLVCLQIKSFGCTCVGTDHPCEEFNKGAAIFVGHVIEDDTKEVKENERKVIKVIVDEEFRGVKKGQVIKIAEFGFCNSLLLPGVNYLVYANKHENGLYSIFMCSRTRSILQADNDFAFLQNLDKVAQASVFGKALTSFKRTANQAAIVRIVPNVQIRIFNGVHSFQARTDKSGHYHISNIPQGKYQIEALLPAGYVREEHTNELKQEIYLIDKGCKEFNVFLSPDNEATRKLLEDEDQSSNPSQLFTLPLLALIFASGLVITLMLLLFIKFR